MHGFILAAAVSLMGAFAGCGGNEPTSPPVVTRQSSVVAGDFNSDGRLDLAISASISTGSTFLPGKVTVYFQDSAPALPGLFSKRTEFDAGIDPAHIAGADVNGDGLPDLLTANFGSDSVSVLLNDPVRPGSFFPAVDYPGIPASRSIAVGDLNRDGLPDLAVAASDGIYILFQNPNARGTFTAPFRLAIAGGAFSAAIGDLDGDGCADIAAAGRDMVGVFFQNRLIRGALSLPASFAAGINPNAVAIADIDRDGLLDIAVANIGAAPDGSGATISVLLQDPRHVGNFLPASNFNNPKGARNLAVSDLNDDGFSDITVASTEPRSQNPGVISVFLQNPAAPGNFLLPASYQGGFTPLSVAIGDLNGDGKQDIVIQERPGILFQDPRTPGIFFNEVVVGP